MTGFKDREIRNWAAARGISYAEAARSLYDMQRQLIQSFDMNVVEEARALRQQVRTLQEELEELKKVRDELKRKLGDDIK